MHSVNVRFQVALLGELSAAMGAGVGSDTNVLPHVNLERALLRECSSTDVALLGRNGSVRLDLWKI